MSKGLDVSSAVSKASREAYKNMFIVPITEGKTVPYLITTKFKACTVKILPASGGTGLKAGSSLRAVLELAGYENVLSKILGSNNKLNNALATIKALSSYKHAAFFNKIITEVPADEEIEEAKDAVKPGEVKVEKGKVITPEAKKEERKGGTEEKIEVKKPTATSKSAPKKPTTKK